MWNSCFLKTGQPVTEAFLHRNVLPRSAAGFEKVSAAMAVRLALLPDGIPRTHFFLIPGASRMTATYIAAALLVGDFAHASGAKKIPARESKGLWENDLLLVTHGITEARQSLSKIRVAGEQPLSAFWEISTLSRYAKTTSSNTKKRIVLSNHGWLLEKVSQHQIGAAIVDATHPRTLARLEELLQGPLSEVQLRIVVGPTFDRSALLHLGYPNKISTWIWDPNSRKLADQIARGQEYAGREPSERTIWVCDGDPELNEALEQLRRQMAAALRKSKGKEVPGLMHCWSIYNRLRWMSVPLRSFDEVSGRTWAGSLKDRVALLDRVEGRGNPIWETDWPVIRKSVEKVYDLLLERREPAKFWALASRLETWLQEKERERLRVVVGSEVESRVLLSELEALIDKLYDARVKGELEIVSVSREASLVAQGDCAATILSGPRTAHSRYLDVYSPWRTEELAYPFEAEMEVAAQGELYRFLESLQEDKGRTSFLSSLGLSTNDSRVLTHSRQPLIRCTTTAGHEIRFSKEAAIEVGIDIDRLASSSILGVVDDDDSPNHSAISNSISGRECTDVLFTNGKSVRYPRGHNIDVYFAETDRIQRESVDSLRPGWHVVTFVDDRYASLFKRITEEVEQRLPIVDRVALALWREAKKKALEKVSGNRTRLYELLTQDGLKSDYTTVTTWFREGLEEVLAPQHKDEFLLLAEYSGCYPTIELKLSALRAIQNERGRNRTAGRALKSFLRAILLGDRYETAMAHFGDSSGDIATAIEILEVAGVTLI